jgi:hypothetical protein
MGHFKTVKDSLVGVSAHILLNAINLRLQLPTKPKGFISLAIIFLFLS